MLDVLKSLHSIASQKQSLMKREQELMAALNRLLPGLGYRIVAAEVSDGLGSGRSARTRRPMTGRRRSIACPHCGRRFAHPLHLGRHVSAMHKNGVSQADARKESTKKDATSGPSKRGSRSSRPRAHRKRARKTLGRAVRKKAATRE
jgi:hypothetical protein